MSKESYQMTLDAANKSIRYACVAGIVSATLTFIASIASLTGIEIGPLDLWSLADAALIALLVFGIHKRSRVCAGAMVIYFLASKIALYVETRSIYQVPLALLFLYFFAQGLRGTIYHHKLKQTPLTPVSKIIRRVIAGLLISWAIVVTVAFINVRASDAEDPLWV